MENGDLMSTLLMFAVLILIFYFFMFRPENKKKKALEEMRNSLKVGDNIITIGGINGTICHIKDDKIVLESGQDRVRIEFEKWAISSNVTAKEAAEKARTEAKANSKKK